jgi:hypothetical protein
VSLREPFGMNTFFMPKWKPPVMDYAR